MYNDFVWMNNPQYINNQNIIMFTFCPKYTTL